MGILDTLLRGRRRDVARSYTGGNTSIMIETAEYFV